MKQSVKFFLLVISIFLNGCFNQKYQITITKINSDTNVAKSNVPNDPNVPAPDPSSSPSPTPSIDPKTLYPGPCQGRLNFYNQSDKKILFYTPAEGSGYYLSADGVGASPYIRALAEKLKAAGYTIIITAKLDQFIDSFDACQLWTYYKQIWMFLPCADGGESISMDQKSIDSLKNYYEAGGGLAVFIDYNYNKYKSNCTMCDWTWGTSSDIGALKTILDISFIYGGGWPGSYGLIKGNLSHPLTASVAQLEQLVSVRVHPGLNAAFKNLDQDEYTGIIEKKVGDLRSIALIFPGVYAYIRGFKNYTFKRACEYSSSAISVDKPWEIQSTPDAFVNIADYFEQKLRVITGNL
ncbi:MAG: hypothetical protein HY072_08400 [Deltaproteobacteria bacterium]|nr:hypothetical protein [Deltaproteobacteria bacterium]